MSETEPSTPIDRRPACDTCKARKTKCDRRSPCSSCITLNVAAACRVSRRAPEKRNRVLLSSKYDEAVQDVKHELGDVTRQLGDVKDMLQTLMSSREPTQGPTDPQPDHAMNTPRSMIDEQVPSLASVHEGYKGDSSFQSHAQQVEDALESTLAARELLRFARAADSAVLEHPVSKPPLRPDDFDLGNKPLPPIEVVLKLLRLTKIEKQRFFVDVPIFEEDEFIAMCRDVYFAMEPISIWSWICVNIGLYYLFLDVTDWKRIENTVEAIHSHAVCLKGNAEAAMQSLRLCSEPSVEACRALGLLGTFYVKEGHSTIAWRLISGGARMALDLGLHRLPNTADSPEAEKKRLVFWYFYAWERELALTCGRTSLIHQDDVTTNTPSLMADRSTITGRMLGAAYDSALITGEIQQTLFSASAQHVSQQLRTQQVRSFATRLIAIQESINSINPQEATWDEIYTGHAVVLDIMLHSLLTLVYRVLPPSPTQQSCSRPHPLQCSDECVDAARRALSNIVQVGERMLPKNVVGWGIILNTVLSLAPFVSFIVLVGNAIATSSSDDLALLSSVVSVLEPAATSPTTKKMHDACERFGRIASLMVSNAAEGALPHKEIQGPSPNGATLPLDGPSDEISLGFPMAQQDWDSVMIGFESELEDVRGLTNMIEPYITDDWR